MRVNGYEYHPMVRVTPPDGFASVWDLRQEFSDCSGQSRTRMKYDLEEDGYQDVNRRQRQTKHGIRIEARLTFDIVRTRDHRALATIVTACAKEGWTVELSLDGGFTYREVIMTRTPSPKPFGGKTVAGARHEIRFETVALLDEMPEMTVEGGW